VLIDRELYLPEKRTPDRERCRVAGIGDGVAFATKPGLAQTMIGRAREAGIPFGWVAGDEVYGGNPGLRSWLEEQGIPYVMAVACGDIIPMAAGGMRADEAAGLVPKGPDACGQRFAPPRTYAPPAFVTDETGRDLIPLTAAEARRLFNLRTRVTRPAGFRRQWPAWRRRRQAAARKSRYAPRLRQLPDAGRPRAGPACPASPLLPLSAHGARDR
jgi:hypothetical protein